MRRLSPAQISDLASLREEQGLSYGQLASRFGVSTSAAQYHCLQQGAVSPTSRAERSRGPRVVECADGRVIRRFTAEEDSRILDLRRQGYGPKRIARTVGRPPTSVRMRLASLALHADGLAATPLIEARA